MDDSLGSDLLWRELILAAVGLGLLLFVVGGLASRVAGTWQLPDGTTWRLRQFGPWVRGVGAVADGHQLLAGRVWFGRLYLVRRDFGPLHLRTLGFDAAQAEAVQGEVTGHFRLRLEGAGVLAGAFTGRSFSFSGPDGRPSSRPAAAQPRRLLRIAG